MTDHIVSKGVGIDLGTTNSAVAVMNPADTDIVIHRDETSKSYTTPSCVWKSPVNGEIVVGRKALRRVGTVPEPVRSVKRLMGRNTPVRLGDTETRPQDVSAAVLAEMKRQIEQDVTGWNTPATSWIVDRAIITVPAYFDHPSIEATREAAEIAGLEVLDLLHEPTAAACYHSWRTGTTDGTFLVYDLGGGTFDVSVVRCTAGAFEVLGISGNTRLGGDDIDTAVARALQEQLLREGYALDLDLEHDPEDRIRFTQLRFLAEGVKKALSRQTEFMINDVASVRDKNGEAVIIETMWERADFEQHARAVVERTIPYCDEAIALATAKAGITLADVDEIILAGGSTHIPLVRELVTRELCAGASEDRPLRAKCAEPVYEKVDTIVALGAAIRASAAGGLAVYDPQRTVRISFRGTGSSSSTRTRVGGRVEALSQEVDLTGGQVKLMTPDYTDETDLRAGGSFAFTGVPLQPGSETLLSFEVTDADGRPVARAGRSIAHDADRRPTGLGTDTAQLAKAFLLEVDRAGRPELKELVPALEHLPATASFVFSHPGDTDLVLFSLYQRRTKIQVIEVPVPSSTQRGTPIEFSVEIDKLALITVRGRIGDVEFDALVRQPPPRGMPTAEEIAAVEESFVDACQFVSAGERAVARAKWNRAYESLKRAVEMGDTEHAVHEIEELEWLIAQISRAEATLRPPKPEFDRLVKECHELNNYIRAQASAAGRVHDHTEIARSIDVQGDHGERAFRDGDQRSYSEAVVSLERMRDHLTGVARQYVEGQDTRTPAERATAAIREVRAQAGQVLRTAEATGRYELQSEIRDVQRELGELERDAVPNPQRVLQRLSQLYARLEQLNTMMLGKQSGGGGKRPEDLS